jgi:hypothetical protein
MKLAVAIEVKYCGLKSQKEITSALVHDHFALLSPECSKIWLDNFGQVPYAVMSELLDAMPDFVTAETKRSLAYLLG